MIIYLLLTLPWMLLATSASLKSQTRRWRQWMMYGFIGTLPFLIWQYYRHSVLRIPGCKFNLAHKLMSAYTTYAFFEWSLVIWDIAFDSLAVDDLSNLKVSLSLASADAGRHP
jgi:hypothetical protein